MRPSSFIFSRPIAFSILLAIVVLLLPALLIPCWISMVHGVRNYIYINSDHFQSGLKSEIENMATVLQPMGLSASKLAEVLTSSLNGTGVTSFSQIENTVAPLLLEGLAVIPYLSQISYIGLEGLFFSYMNDNNQTFAVYSNSTVKDDKKGYIWYTQPVYGYSGHLYGSATVSAPMATTTANWFKEALNSPSGSASMGNKWNGNTNNLLFVSTARLDKDGVVSLGFSEEAITKFFRGIELHGVSLYLVTEEGYALIEGIENTRIVLSGNLISFQLLGANGDKLGVWENISCQPDEGMLRSYSIVDIRGTKYSIHCSTVEVLGVNLVYVLACPESQLLRFIGTKSKGALILIIATMVSVAVSIFSFVLMIVRAAIRKMHLYEENIRLKEAISQAERKSLNKSSAFSNASHDIRGSLGSIKTLVKICRGIVTPGSELDHNLSLISSDTEDLLGLLNSILDVSKIEAGKMQLEEEDFDLSRLMEEVVDLHYPKGLEKGVDVVLDPCDGSVLRHSHLRGDRRRLKQILTNLLSNAVKFTPEGGNVSVRAWVQKPSYQKTIVPPRRKDSMNSLFFKRTKSCSDLEAMNPAEVHNPNCMQLVCEVDDTGIGIPKEKRESVFENYVQVGEKGFEQEGTGLGLGIVQSLVRLMQGEIAIVDKMNGERGTCFKFNVLLKACETISNDNTREDVESGYETCQHLGLTIRTSGSGLSAQRRSPSLSLRSPSFSPRFAFRNSSPRADQSLVVLLMPDDQRRTVVKNFIERLNISVVELNSWEQLHPFLKETKEKQNHSRHSSKGIVELSSSSTSRNSSTRAKEIPLSSTDGLDHLPLTIKKNSHKGMSGCTLIVIDANAGPFEKLGRILAEFKHGLQGSFCKVVWLNKQPLSCEDIDPNDVFSSRPFHGRRLYEVIRLLPEFGGTFSDNTESRSQTRSAVRNTSSSSYQYCHRREDRQQHPSGLEEIQLAENGNSGNDQKLLTGKKILVAEDNAITGHVTFTILSKLGATVELCENGKKAVKKVRKGYENQRKHGGADILLPYDYILMDCKMPDLDGFEATRQIRELESNYRTRVPIIALTALKGASEELTKIAEAGMDAFIEKPLSEVNIQEAVRNIL